MYKSIKLFIRLDRDFLCNMLKIAAFLFKLPVHLVYALVILEEVAKFTLGLIRLKSRKWINNIT